LNGKDLYIDVPIGSRIINLEDKSEFSLLQEGETMKVLQGGKGGFGNEHFKSSTNVAPEEQTNGTPGQEGNFLIELELLVDLGFVGLPSAGKSTLLNYLTNSNAKVGAYPFTTLEPSLGVFYKYILADIPGLIEGAAEGKGLGHKFLKHIKRTKAIAHLVSFEYDDMINQHQKITEELKKYSPELIEKPELIILSKSDMVSENTVLEMEKKFKETFHKPVVSISVIDDERMKSFSKILSNFLAEI